MSPTNRPVIKQIALAVGALLVIAIAIFAVREIKQHGTMLLSKSSPTAGSSHVSIVEPVVFTFNHNLDSGATQSFSISPHVAGTTTISSKTLAFKPTFSYGYGVEYTATIANPKSTNGLTGKTATIKFKPRALSDNELTTTQRQELDSKTDQILNDPLVGALPADSLDYRLDFDVNSSTGQVTYHAQLNIYNKYPNDPGYTARYRQDLARYKQEVLDFIRSKGKDPNKLNVTWDPTEATGL